jgi:hypothetical protein
MPTPLSSATSYCTPADLLTYSDWRPLADMLDDNGARLTRPEVLANAKLASCLDAASGQLESACLVGMRYTPTDLAALTGVGLERLKEVVAALALLRVFRRRELMPVELRLMVEDAEKQLTLLEQGYRVFGLAEHADAGLPAHEKETVYDIEARNGTTWQARRFFGRRGVWEG